MLRRLKIVPVCGRTACRTVGGIADIAERINKVYKQADYVGSLIVEGPTDRVAIPYLCCPCYRQWSEDPVT